VGVEVPSRAQAEAIVAALREKLANHSQVRPELPLRVAFSGVREGVLQLRLECGLSGDPEAFHALRQELLLEVGDELVRQGGRLAPGQESPRLRSAPDGADPP
jgi:hypothetical protein